MNTDYQQILALIDQKDPSGLEALYQAYGKKFYAYALRRWSLDEDEAWEVVYQTLETLVLKLSNYRFESEAHLNNFLYKVFLNFLRQYVRKNRNKLERDIQYVDLNEAESGCGSIHKQFEKRAFVEYFKSETIDSPALIILKGSLDKLDPTDKELLLLRVQNYSYDEIAQFLGVENSHLKVKHLRAKQKLMNLLNEPQNR